MPTGVVKWFDAHKHFGFIAPDEGGLDLFVHISAVRGGSSLKQGQGVEYDIQEGMKGLEAHNVRHRPKDVSAPSTPRRVDDNPD